MRTAIGVLCLFFVPLVCSGDEIGQIINRIDFEIEELDAAIAKIPRTVTQRFPNGVIEMQNPQRGPLLARKSDLDQHRRELVRFQRYTEEALQKEMTQRGQTAANKWALTQTRGTVKRMLKGDALRKKADAEAGAFMTEPMKAAFCESYMEECERYANATRPTNAPNGAGK